MCVYVCKQMSEHVNECMLYCTLLFVVYTRARNSCLPSAISGQNMSMSD